MPRINLDLEFLTHPKTVSISPLAQLLFIRSLIYSARHLTDGFVPSGAIAYLTCDMSNVNNLDITDHNLNDIISELESVGWWTKITGGHAIHDYLDYQLSRKDVESTRKKRAQASVKNGKLGGRPKKPTDNLAHNLEANLDVTQNNPTNPNPNPNLSSPNPKKDSTKKDKSGDEPATFLGLEDSDSDSERKDPSDSDARPPATTAARLTVEHVRERWNAIHGVKLCKKIDGALAVKIKNLIHKYPPAWWDDLFAEIPKSAFLSGKVQPTNGKRPFKINLDWATGPINLGKILSGNYDDSQDARAKAKAVW